MENKKINNTLTGDAGEFLTLYHLARLGFKCHHVPSVGYDLLVENENSIKRISVKARNSVGVAGYGFRTHVEVGRSGNNRGTKENILIYADIVACVALDLERVVFVDCKKINSDNIYIKKREFFVGCEEATLFALDGMRAQRAIISNDEDYQFNLF